MARKKRTLRELLRAEAPCARSDRPSVSADETGTSAYDGCRDDCLGCAGCLPLLAARRVPKAHGFTLAAYDFVAAEGSDQRDELVAEAYGVALPDGRAVVYCVDPYSSGEPELRVWPNVRDAAFYWGSFVLWGREPECGGYGAGQQARGGH